MVWINMNCENNTPNIGSLGGAICCCESCSKERINPTTKVINKRNATGNVNEVYIGRGGPFGNPVALGKTCPVCGDTHFSRGTTLECYKVYLFDRMEADSEFKKAVESLKGKVLVCFCKPKACHGDVLAAWLDEGGEDGNTFTIDFTNI